MSVEWQLDDLEKRPDVIHVWGERQQTGLIGQGLADVLDHVSRLAPPSIGNERIDLRDPPHDD